jgi:oxepin-CoA hydrolase/3-oxo-5,6-dehydrosuberyl-CoA semialdehyde dehydrogenase
MQPLHNYAAGKWIQGDTAGDQTLYHAITGAPLYTASSAGLDIAEMMHYARTVGGTALRRLTFQERGRMLKALALHLMEKKEVFYNISYATGATRADAWIDIEGGIGNLFAYASLRRRLPDLPYYIDGDTAKLSVNGSFVGQHIMTPKHGVAIHINAYNFPVWGMLEKIAVNLLAGVPAIVKPATLTSFLTEAVVQEIVKSNILPAGSLQLVCGAARNIIDFVTPQDLVTFTGSASVGQLLKNHPMIVQNAVPFNMEADSLNCAVLGLDATPDTPEFDLFIKEVTREMTAKCGQKCTAIRRIIIPENLIETVQAALSKRLAAITIGNPKNPAVRMGALAARSQVADVKSKITELSRQTPIVYGSLDGEFDIIDGDTQRGAFMSPVLMLNAQPFAQIDTHNIEAFGPAVTLMPYKTTDEAIAIANLGKGSLVSSIITNDIKIATEYTMGASCYHGRILILNRTCAKESTGHGAPMPMLTHGGPGRAGGGEEMGGLRGVMHYLQRTALQGSPTMLSHITQTYQYGGAQTESEPHVFRKYFEDLNIGDTVTTHKRTITEADIVNFGNVSWDHFYAHTDHTSLHGTIFEKPVAHGYFILSAAAGLFVDARKGPVILNYGLDECRFTKPVYAGSTIGVRLTVKEKIAQEQKNDEDTPKGIVKFLVDVYDETNETVAIATILTMVKKREVST